MKRLLAALLLATTLSAPSLARADFLGFIAQGQSGFVKTERSASWAIGGMAAVELLGFELYLDLRYLEANSDWFWNSAGLRFPLSLPVPGADITAYIGSGFVGSSLPEDQLIPLPNGRNEPHAVQGITVDGGLRIGINLGSSPFVLGVMAEVGSHFWLLNADRDDMDVIHASGMGFLKFDV